MRRLLSRMRRIKMIKLTSKMKYGRVRVVQKHKLLTISFLMIIKQDELSTLPLKMER